MMSVHASFMGWRDHTESMNAWTATMIAARVIEDALFQEGILRLTQRARTREEGSRDTSQGQRKRLE